MKKFTSFMTVAALVCGMTMAVGCNKDEDENGSNNGGNTGNLPTTIDENFDNGIPDTWTVIDADGDGYTWCNWINMQDGSQSDPYPCAISFSYLNGSVGALTPDNYLVSPKIYIEEGATLTYETEGIDQNYFAEHYAVLLGTIENGTFKSIATVVEEDVPSVNVTPHSYDLSQWKGKSVCIAFRHYNCTDIYTMKLDNVKVSK